MTCLAQSEQIARNLKEVDGACSAAPTTIIGLRRRYSTHLHRAWPANSMLSDPETRVAPGFWWAIPVSGAQVRHAPQQHGDAKIAGAH